ncbi:MAG: hypothetical protein ACE5G7_06645, partial [Candidatus Hydrothermarchaeaceae archaeon]
MLKGEGYKRTGYLSKSTERGCRVCREDVENSIMQAGNYNPEELNETGREQFFRHYSKSKLPIRDIINKTEPHIEVGAENYKRPCLKRNINGSHNRLEKYLFLCTTCQNKEVGNGGFFGKRLIVGYIKKRGWVDFGNRKSIIGDMYIVPFDKRLNYDTLNLKRSRGMRRFDGVVTAKLLKLIHSNNNILSDCMKEMIA